ncbi:MAG: hypothetical protein ACREA0_05105, partial [bacterium]
MDRHSDWRWRSADTSAPTSEEEQRLPASDVANEAQERSTRKHSLWPVALVAFCLGLLVFWYTPAVLYANNEGQFFFPLRQILPVLAVPLLLTVVVLAGLALPMPPRARRFYCALLACVTAYLWVQGFLLVRDYGLLDGEIVLPSFAAGPLIASGLMALAASVVVSRGVTRVALVLGVFSTALVAHLGLLVAKDSNPVRTLEPSRVASFYELGSENVIVVLLDALQSDVFAEVLDDRPELAARLDGFTYYPNTLGVGRSTYVALPTIHSGRVHQPGTSLKDHFDRSIVHESFLTELAAAGWRAALLNPVAGVCPRGIDACFPYDESRTSSSRTRLLWQSAELLDLAMFRLAPSELKGVVYNANQWRLQSAFNVPSSAEAGDTALRDFTANLQVADARKSVRFLHLQSTHAPATRKADCSLLEEPLPITRETAVGVTTCALTRVGDLVEQLERLGAYEGTSIVVL